MSTTQKPVLTHLNNIISKSYKKFYKNNRLSPSHKIYKGHLINRELWHTVMLFRNSKESIFQHLRDNRVLKTSLSFSVQCH